ncbi:MAG: peptidoglycan/LPS O-acetylase OafA/YrhL [Halioglobus sp.]|jgi:peptidoglycan/LPS O-acetylase OafA/YrhL
MRTTDSYRQEIDGLRAVSVLAIIFFHLKLPGFAGGFIGVDIFFVVSGYLITNIITSSLRSGTFSFRDFYIRRTARILPALIVTVLLTLIAASYIQQPQALAHTAQQALAALFSISNIFFWLDASYWAPSSESYVLLHTWSLGVEEQFYLIYPLLLFGCYRLGGEKAVVTALVIIVIAGIGANEFMQKTSATATFYLAPFRFYEFALGGLGALLGHRATLLLRSTTIAGAATVLGLTMILISVLNFTAITYALRSYTILLPLTGALLILLSGPSPVSRIVLTNSMMTWLGKTSYAAYLVHWPMITFYRYLFGAELSFGEQLGLFIAILAASALLSRGVERRFRLLSRSGTTPSGIPQDRVLRGVGLSILCLSLGAGLLYTSQGWPGRMPPQAQALIAIAPNADMKKRRHYLEQHCLPSNETFCGERQPGKQNILLLGDSRVLDIYLALREAYPDANIQASYAMGCAPVFSRGAGRSPFFANCPQFNADRLQWALEAPVQDIIFLAQDINLWRSTAVQDTVRTLVKAGKKVYVLGEFKVIKGRSPIEIAVDELRFSGHSGRLENFIVEHPFSMDESLGVNITAMGATYVSNKPFFYDGEYSFRDRESGQLLTFDGKHLNEYGARRFAHYLKAFYPLP